MAARKRADRAAQPPTEAEADTPHRTDTPQRRGPVWMVPTEDGLVPEHELQGR